MLAIFERFFQISHRFLRNIKKRKFHLLCNGNFNFGITLPPWYDITKMHRYCILSNIKNMLLIKRDNCCSKNLPNQRDAMFVRVFSSWCFFVPAEKWNKIAPGIFHTYARNKDYHSETTR